MSASRMTSIRLVLLFAAGLLTSTWAYAACEQPVGAFVSITGSVDVQPSGDAVWTPAGLDRQLCEGDTIRVGERSRAAVSLINDAVLRIDQNTAMRLIDVLPEENESSLLDVLRGAIQSFSRKPKFLKVNTPYLNGSVEGTEFAVRVDDGATSFTVFEGVVVAANDAGEVALQPGESATAGEGQAPQRRTVVNPRDLVQWALYYPPVLATAALAGASPALNEAANCAANGNIACAFAALDRVPSSQRDANYTLLHASLLLAVGRVDAASAEIERALTADRQASAAHALRAVIGVTQNRSEEALADGRRAVELDPASAAAKIALSYALQANLELAAARDTLLQAVERQPDNALAWARLAELHLAEGRRAAATTAAERAVQLQPGLSRTQNVLGFSALAEIKVEQAQAAFEQAIALDSADPLPHLGLGLAKIRQGMLAEGRKQIEAAVALDSNNALLRAYLGKAYFEEKRGPLDAQQFRIAKELDPLDPTAYFYNAISLQTENRPVEALRELEASIARNDNRAVYRSRLLLDQDRAARGTSQARVHRDLGFRQLGINAAVSSVTTDPANASAHRFLSDSYRGAPRGEIARVSELFQAQMMQDVNINPVQPSLSETNLNIVTLGGPASAGFNEFTPLFQRDESQLNVAGFGGSNDMAGGEAVVSGVHGRFSYSAGAFTSQSDGWRPNNRLEQDLYNVYLQAAISPTVNIQAEFQRRDTTEGDFAFNFDPTNFSADRAREFERDTARVGLRFSPAIGSTFLLSYIDSDVEERTEETQTLDPFTLFAAKADMETSGSLVEAQYIHQAASYNVVAGAAYGEADSTLDAEFTFIDVTFGPLFTDGSLTDEDVENPRGYVYVNLDSAPNLTWTIGASYDKLKDGAIDVSGFNPKFGVQWAVSESLRLRGAAFRVVKPSLVNNRTLEPTQVAGFNQLFDDLAGTESWRYAAGLDWRITPNLAWGLEATWRDIDEPNIEITATGDQVSFTEDKDEQTHRLYAYWTPTNRIAVSGEVVYDRFESEQGLNTDFGPVPEELETISVPLGVSYSDPRGYFGTVVGTFVDQKVTRSATAPFAQGSDSFFLVDLAVGYRLPKRRGIISVGVKNLFDEEFMYQDNSFREFGEDSATPLYVPDRLIMGQLVLSF